MGGGGGGVEGEGREGGREGGRYPVYSRPFPSGKIRGGGGCTQTRREGGREGGREERRKGGREGRDSKGKVHLASGQNPFSGRI